MITYYNHPKHWVLARGHFTPHEAKRVFSKMVKQHTALLLTLNLPTPANFFYGVIKTKVKKNDMYRKVDTAHSTIVTTFLGKQYTNPI